MRTVLTQGHSQNLRDLLLNYELDNEGSRIIDFTFGTGGLWKTDYKYQLSLTKTDAVPTTHEVVKKNMTEDDYSDLGVHDGAIFDPPYLYGHQAFNYGGLKQPWADPETWLEKQNVDNKYSLSSQVQGKNSWAANGELARFTENKNEQVFIERIKGLNRVGLQCLKKDALLFVKVMDTMNDGWQVPNHKFCIDYLTNFRLYATFIYFAGGAKTWKSHAETSHGFYLVFKLTTDKYQTQFS